MASSIPSFILRHVFGFFHLKTQLQVLGLVSKGWHHASLCMNCITSSSSKEEMKNWFEHYFDTDVVELMIKDFYGMIGVPYSYVVRNLVFQVLRDIQQSVRHLEHEILVCEQRLNVAQDQSERLCSVYQLSALLYLLKMVASAFNIYDIFEELPLVNSLRISVFTRAGLRLFVRMGALLAFRFDGFPDHLYDETFHKQAAIKCFDLKLLIKKSVNWIPLFELVEATISAKFLHPDLVFPNFEQNFESICKNRDFMDFNEVLALLESNTSPPVSGKESPVNDTHTDLTAPTEFDEISNEFLATFMNLSPTESCDRHHGTRFGSNSICNSPSNSSSDENSNDPNNNSNSKKSHQSTKNGNTGAGQSTTSTSDNGKVGQGDGGKEGHKSGASDSLGDSMDEIGDVASTTSETVEMNSQHNSLNNSQDNNSLNNSQDNNSTSSSVCGKRNAVGDYKYYFAGEDSEDGDFGADADYDGGEAEEEFGDGDKENEPPAKLIKVARA